MYSGTISSEELVGVLISCSPVSVDAQSVAAIIHQVLDILDQQTISLSETSSRSSISLRMRIPLRFSHGYVVETGTAVLSDPLSGGTGGYG